MWTSTLKGINKGQIAAKVLLRICTTPSMGNLQYSTQWGLYDTVQLVCSYHSVNGDSIQYYIASLYISFASYSLYFAGEVPQQVAAV